MPTLLFTLSPANVRQFSDILTCLGKFNEDVSLEATTSELRVSSLNTARTAHAAFSLHSNQFFEKYHFSPDQRGQSNAKIWTCKVQNRALYSVFWRKLAAGRDSEAALERCEFELQARADQPECRLVFRMMCRAGVVKTYRLTYETGEILHASFDRSNSSNTWTISSKTLRDVVEYFGPKTEQLDWFLQDGKMTFTSYTEKIQNGREILKQPMHTSVALERQDFDDCKVEEGLHIGIVVKDFRAIVSHAEAIQVQVSARYSRGNRPMQIIYTHEGMVAEFTLMTRSSGSLSATPSISTPRNLSVRPMVQTASTRQSSTVPAASSSTQMAPPDRQSNLKRKLDDADDGMAKPQATTPPPPTASINPDSLFIPANDGDQQWDEPNYDDDDGDMVTWDNATEAPDPSMPTRRIRDSEPISFANHQDRDFEKVQEIAPTQRLSQMRGMFD